MKKFIRFSKIKQFRDTIQNIKHSARFVGVDENNEPIYNPHIELPTIKFTGTVKLHGTNSSAVTDHNEIWFQSKKRIVTPTSDNYDFSQFGLKREEIFQSLFDQIKKQNIIPENSIISIFGEYCGKGIQGGVGISCLPKMFVIFAVKITINGEGQYLDHSNLRSPENDIYNILDYQTFQVDIDFNYPQIAQGKMTEFVKQIEEQCPVAKAFNTKGTGEGIVWTGYFKGNRHIFKTKGEKHSNTRPKKKKKIPINPEKMESVKEFVAYAVTENRMNQAVEQLFISENKTPTIKNIGEFLKWVNKDIAEEETDVLLNNDLVMKDVNKSISAKARAWFQEYLDKQIGL